MDLDNIKCYVKKYSEAYMPLSSIKAMAGVYIFIGIISLVAGIVTRKYIVLSITVTLTILYVMGVNILERKITSVSYYQRFLFSGISSLFMSMFFLLIPYLLIETGAVLNKTKQILYSTILGLAWILAVFLIFGFKIYNIKKGNYRKIKNVRKNRAGLATASSMGAIAGISFMKIVSKWMTQEIALHVVIILSFFVSVLAALGIPHLLISYFVKKYSIPGESITVKRRNRAKPIRHPVLRKTIKIMAIAILVILIIVIILGVLIDKGILK